ncbi:MAG: 4-hydroxy-tetrahydrodipicolinate reductase [Bacteroidales bacterium]|nr:4-hydroxy-tetrahydrodipicolinate reductase [Bacteroidales bacterium]MBR2127380.1 4-hydroxy-tetrahydrodipicolinate reductase [Bacteroidales bacterium]
MKTRIYISGYGKMGKMVEKIILSKGLEYAGWSEAVTETDPALAKECVCIDFTTPAAFKANYRFLAENFKAVVVGTTGWADIRDEVVAYFEKCGTPMIWATNFSVGVNAFFAVTDYVSRLLGEAGGYSPYMVEMHHCHKLDAPSGTAKTLADIVDANMATKVDVQSVRCGEIPGIHTVGFEGANDRITMTHEAFSREGFASGAVVAALKTEGLTGVHEFKDLILSFRA